MGAAQSPTAGCSNSPKTGWIYSTLPVGTTSRPPKWISLSSPTWLTRRRRAVAGCCGQSESAKCLRGNGEIRFGGWVAPEGRVTTSCQSS